jgi:glutamine amidotransferase
MVHPIMDKYYDRNPRHRRSAAYVQAKGLTANEKTGANRGVTALPTPSANLDLEVHKRFLGPTIPFGNSTRSRTPETSSLPRTRTPLSLSETSTQLDVQSVTEPPVIRPNPNSTPSQGNIKKKRASLSAIDAMGSGPLAVGVISSYADIEQQSPLTPDAQPHRTEYGNPNKIAQFFPELNLAQ